MTLYENMLFCHGFKNDICIHCLHVFNMKWNKNQFGDRKVVGQATVLAHWAQKVGGWLPTLPNKLRCQWLPPTDKSSAVAEMGDRLATTDIGWKVGGCCAPFRGGSCVPSNIMSPGLRPTSIPSGILIHPTVWPQYTNVTDRHDRQDNGPVA